MKSRTYMETPPRAWGRPTRQYSKPISTQKHPHVRGEDDRRRRPPFPSSETPPRAWGRRQTVLINEGNYRNTPTCVGKTCRARLRRPQPSETPPRAWGRLKKYWTNGGRDGNTPTCVGKTPIRKRCVRNDGKHPHVRGEDSKEERDQWRERETPPRAWGRPAYEIQHGADGRNTPTCVGKTTVLDQKGR